MGVDGRKKVSLLSASVLVRNSMSSCSAWHGSRCDMLPMQDTGDFHHRDFLILVSLPRRRNNMFIKVDRSTCPTPTNPCPMIITPPCHSNPPHNLQHTTVKRSAAASVDLVASTADEPIKKAGRVACRP
ncbi:hypothetical protein J1614_003188 [Plenodomus biglobosus]|nr:hypothetical protein J1614_003188 [Plenodomus biglobosus]